MDSPVWRLSYTTIANLGCGPRKEWVELWKAYVRPTKPQVQGYWTYAVGNGIYVSDLCVEPAVAHKDTKVIVEV